MAFLNTKESAMLDDDVRARLIVELSMHYQCEPEAIDDWCVSVHNKSFWALPGDVDNLKHVRLPTQADYIDRLYPEHAGKGADYESVMKENATQIFNAATDPNGLKRNHSGYGGVASKATDLTLTVLAQQLKPLMVLSLLQSAPYTSPRMTAETAMWREDLAHGPFDSTHKSPGFWSFCADWMQQNLALHAARYAKSQPTFQPKTKVSNDSGDDAGATDNKPSYRSPEP